MSTIDLPLPPSTNALWRANRGRVHKSKRYGSWLKEAGWQLVLLRRRNNLCIAGPVKITIAAGRPDRRRRDIDNLGKAVLDFLQLHRVIEDDSKVVSLSSSWSHDVAAGRVHVTVKRAHARKQREAGAPVGRGLDL